MFRWGSATVGGSLDARWWEEVDVKMLPKDVGARAFRPVHGVATQVLHGTDGTPLCALQIAVEGKMEGGVAAQTVSYSRTDDNNNNEHNRVCRTHVLTNADKVPFKIVLTNFSSEHQLFVPIVKTDAAGDKTLGAVNQINVVEPWSVQVIEADASAGSRKLILEMLNSGISVGKDEQEVKTKAKAATDGLYFFMSVKPPTNSGAFRELFAKTTWMTETEFVVVPNSKPAEIPVPQHQSLFGIETQSRSIQHFVTNESFIDRGERLESLSADDDDLGGVYRSLGSSASWGYGAAAAAAAGAAAGAAGQMAFVGSIAADEKRSKPVAKGAMRGQQMDENMVLESRAATIKHGEKVDVSSRACQTTFDETRGSKGCVVGLSVAPALVFSAAPGPIDPERLMLFAAATKGNFLDLLTNSNTTNTGLGKTFVSEECSICLGEKPDALFYPCRHQCTHFACMTNELKTCPLCRTVIKACLKPSTPLAQKAPIQSGGSGAPIQSGGSGGSGVTRMVPFSMVERERLLFAKMLEMAKRPNEDLKLALSNSQRFAEETQEKLKTVQRNLRETIEGHRHNMSGLVGFLEGRSLLPQPPADVLLCPRLHALRPTTERPPTYAPACKISCDVCDKEIAVNSLGAPAFLHCYSCLNYDMCHSCHLRAIAAKKQA